MGAARPTNWMASMSPVIWHTFPIGLQAGSCGIRPYQDRRCTVWAVDGSRLRAYVLEPGGPQGNSRIGVSQLTTWILTR